MYEIPQLMNGFQMNRYQDQKKIFRMLGIMILDKKVEQNKEQSNL